jgi:hypothetical protein
MSGGLCKSTSLFALIASAGLAFGGITPARAADLGGDCCADLEERVATLEATTVRKGTNKVSLKISGQVNRAIVWWDDGRDSDTYAGVDNAMTSTRWRFEGDAKISARVKAGYIIEWENADASGGAGTASSLLTGKNANGHFNQLTGGTTDGGIEMRLANWYLEDTQLGRVTVGRLGIPGSAFGAVDFGGVNVYSSIGGESQFPPGRFNMRNGAGQYSSNQWLTIGVVTLMGARAVGIRYDTPTFAGLQGAAWWGDDDDWSLEARWAGKVPGFTMAAIVGYQRFTSESPNSVEFPGTNPANGNRRDQDRFTIGAGIQHDATGLFVQGGYLRDSFGSGVRGTANGVTSFADFSIQPDRTQWAIQAGISQNWFGIGKTTLFGEYGRNEDFGVGTTFNFGTFNPATGAVVAGATRTIASAETEYWGIGIVQAVDAAAMDLYLGYKHFSADVTSCAGGAVANLATCQLGATATDIKDFDLVVGGARIKF